jgi:acetoin utilization protein AcuB
MLVRDCMTGDPITVRPESDPMAAMMVLRSGGFRHLPVLGKDGRLVGIVDRTDLRQFLSEAGSPSVMKRQHYVEQVMTREVVTVPPDCPLEEAASLMVRHKIGSLPVIDEGKLVGIITETDIFKQFVAALGGGTDTIRLSVQVDNIPGQIAALASAIARVNGNILSMVTYPAKQAGRINLTLRVEGVDCETIQQAIKGLEGIVMLYVWCSDEDGIIQN